MPLTRYQIRNEYSLADPDLYRAADKDDVEALLEGVAMAGLVGVLRQLGDLAEFAAEIFHDLHEEVMATAARGHTLMVRVQQLEAEVPALEKEFLSRTNHSSFYTNAGVDWHPNLHMEQNLITQGDLPRCVMDSYEECWGPPRLFLLDKFDVAGAGACLKRYTDPSFFKNETDTSLTTHLEVQREKKTRKSKKKGSRWKNADAESVATSHAKLHQLFLEESIENVFSDPARLVKLKKRHFNGSPLDPKSGKSYMEKFLETTSPDIDTAIYERTINLPLPKMTSENSSESGLEIVEIRAVSPKITLAEAMESTSVSANGQDMVRNACVENLNSAANNQAHFVMGEPAAANDMYGALRGSPTAKVNVVADGCKYKRRDLDGDHSDDITSEVENFMDALATIDSEIETDNEGQSRNDLHLADKKYRAYSDVNAEQLESHAHSSDSQSFGISYISDYGDSSSKKSQSSFSSSDSISNVTENIASDDETHSQKCKTEKLHAPCVSLSTDVEKTQGSNSDKIHEDQLHYNGEVLSISSPTDTSGTSVEMKPRENSVIDLPLEHKLCREPSSNVKLSSDMYTTNKNEPNVPDSSAVSSDLSANFIFSGNVKLNESNVGGKSISSDALMHQTETMKPDLHCENGDSCLDKAKPIDSTEEVCVANSGNLVACSQEFVVMDAKGLLNCSTMAESEDCLGRTVVVNKLDDTILAQPDFEIGATVEASTESENVTELAHIPMSHKTIEQKLSDTSSGVSKEEVGYSNFVREVDLEKVSREVDNGESGNSSIKVDDMEESPAASDTAANWRDDSGNNDHVVSDEPLTEDRLNDTATSTTVAVGSDISGNLSSDSIHSVLVEPAANGHDDSGNNDHIVSDEPLTEDRPDDFSTSTTVANGSDISGNASSDSIHSVLVDPVVSGKSLSDAGDPHQPEMEVITENVSPSLTTSERRCDEADVPAVGSDSEELVSTPVGFCNLKGNVQSLAPGEQSDTPASDEGVSLESSDPYAQSNILPAVCLRESREYLTAASLFSQLSEPGTCSIQSPGIPIDQLNDGSASRNEVTAVATEVSDQSSDVGVNSNELETNPSTFSPSTYALLDDTSKARAEETPPLPPLPPMQWRMMKADQFFQASHNDLSKNDKGLLPVLSQCSTEQNAQYELSVPEMGTVMPWHRFLPEASEEVKQPYDSGKVGRNYAQPTLHEPDCLNNGDEEFSLSSNPFLTESGHTKETHECRSPTLEQDVQSSNPALPLLIDEATSPEHESLSLFDESLQTSLDNSMDATSEGNSVQHGLQEQEELVQDHIDTSITQPSTFQEQPPNTVEEQAPNRVEQQPPTQVEEKNSKIEEDSSDEVSKHPQNDDKVQLPIELEEHTSNDAEKEALKDIEDQPSAQAELQHPPEAEKQSQHVILTSGGDIPQMYSAFALPGLSTSETFFPPHSRALLPINEAGKPNGHPTVKLPRPRNPLIDAVAAVDKSKMRKVTDRVQPPVGQKADERDTFLEQIRKKSFDLKPTVGTRPSIQNIQGPRTNLRLAAILEKANAIRQATAGSDEDEDSWSDS